MKEYLELYKEKDNRYYTIHRPNPPLWNLNYFLENDYSFHKKDMFLNKLNFYNVTYVYNDFKNKFMYVGFSEWSVNEDVESPDEENFSQYVNETNSCKITIDNFKEFVEKWLVLKKEYNFPFLLMYRDDNDWVDCKGFQTEKEMELFVKNDSNNN